MRNDENRNIALNKILIKKFSNQKNRLDWRYFKKKVDLINKSHFLKNFQFLDPKMKSVAHKPFLQNM